MTHQVNSAMSVLVRCRRALSRAAFASAVLLIFASLTAAAEEADGPWTGTVRLGYLSTTGNSETENMNFAFGVGYALGNSAHTLAGSAVGVSEREQTTAEAYTLGWKSTYDFTEFDYLFGRVDWLKDKFSGYDQQLSESVGYGRRLINHGNQFLSVEIGAGARQARLRDGQSENEAIIRLGANYQYQFNDSAQFNFDLGVQTGEENTFTEAVSALKTNLVGSLAAVISHTVRNNTEVPAGSEKTDTVMSVALEYAF
jgi:putative salt-induced outer membrane protein